MAILKNSANLLSNLIDDRLAHAMEFITEVINDALRKTFPQKVKKISLSITSFRDSYPQLNVKLLTPEGVRNLKTQEGTGVKQIISVFYIMCLIYISGGRKFVYADEILDGLHEDAIEIMDTLFDVFIQDLDFQIIINEHGYPITENTVAYILGLTDEGTQIKEVRFGWDNIEETDEVTDEVTEEES